MEKLLMSKFNYYVVRMVEAGSVFDFNVKASDPLNAMLAANLLRPNASTIAVQEVAFKDANFCKAMAAIATCEHLGYTHEGGEQWKPPLGPKPDFARDHTLLGELLAVIHRDGGQHQEQHGTWLAVRDAINVVQALRLKTEEKLKTYTIDVKVDATHVAAAIDSWLAEHKEQVAAREAGELENTRVKFEAWYLTDIADARFAQQETGYMKSLRDGDHYGAHRTALNNKWKGWRAAKGLK